MSCCNHFRDFLVLSSADLTRLTLVDSASGPAPVNKDNKNKTVLLLTVNQLSNAVVLFCQSRPRIVCCFDLLLRGRSLTFASSFRRFVTALLLRLATFLDFSSFSLQKRTHTQTHKRNDEVISLFAWILLLLAHTAYTAAAEKLPWSSSIWPRAGSTGTSSGTRTHERQNWKASASARKIPFFRTQSPPNDSSFSSSLGGIFDRSKKKNGKSETGI